MFPVALSAAQIFNSIYGATPTNPLSALEGQGYNVSSFVYPIDLGVDPAEMDFLVIHVNASDNSQYDTTNPFSINPSAPPVGIPTINQAGNITNFKQKIHRVPTTICLYIPPSVQTSYNADWDTVEFNASGNVWQALQEGDIARSLKEVGVGVIKGLVDDAKNFIKDKAGVDTDLAGLGSLAGRVAINPHAEMLFRGIGFRQWQFQYKFTPRSEQEATNVFNIIKALKFYAAPEVNNKPGQARYWIYPAEFDLEFWANGRPSNFLNKISTCACTNITIDYTASGGWSAFRPGKFNGVPVETNLTLTFQELEIITKSRIKEGF